MAASELSPEENAHLREAMRGAIKDRFGSANKLALALGIQGPSLGSFLKGGGAAKTTARKFAEIMGRTYEEVIGHGNGRKHAAHAALPPKFRPTADAARKARVLLK